MNHAECPTSLQTAPDIDPVRWPDVAVSTRAPLRGAVARAVTRRAADLTGVRVQTSPHLGIDDVPTIRVLDADEFYSRIGSDGLIGLGDAWMSQAWTSPDLHAVLHALAQQLRDVVPRPLQQLRRWYNRRMPDEERGDRDGARSNVSRHYDLSNDLFATFLDPTMTYSSALFAPGDDLETAQVRKLETLLDAVGVGPGTRLLEIGSGWGSLAVRAARRGARVTTITLSSEQLAHTRAAAREAGVDDRVDACLCDFRDATGRYDAIISIEMIEAVGERYWPAFFACLDERLVPSGRIGLQAITMDHDHMLATRNSWGWIHKYIFPGGLIPSVRSIADHAGAHGDLTIQHRRSLGTHYGETLRQWRRQFNLARPHVEALGFDEVFCRMWDYYLAYSQAGFTSGHLDVEQLVLTKGGRH